MGDGPTQGTLQDALDIRLQSTRWRLCHGDAYRSLVFDHSNTVAPKNDILELKIDGSLTALVMIQLLLEPYPVNPFLVYAAFFNNAECLEFLLRPYREYKPEHLLAMMPDRETRDLLAAVIAHDINKPYTHEEVADDPLLSRAVVMEGITMPIPMFADAREPHQHKGLVQGVLANLLIGHADAWKQVQFEAFQAGLHLGICNVDDILKVRQWIMIR